MIETPEVEVMVVVKVTVVVKVKVWVEGLFHCKASCKHLAMTALLLLVTMSRDERCRHRISAGYATKPRNVSVILFLSGGWYLWSKLFSKC